MTVVKISTAVGFLLCTKQEDENDHNKNNDEDDMI